MISAQGSPPSGIVTFLFTDIEGSTRLWEEHPSDMQSAVARHDVILRTAIAAEGGHVFSTAGDSFAAAFLRPGDAVAAAIAAQRMLLAEDWPSFPIRVRMGLHPGVAQERGGDYFGPSVNRAVRLMAAGHGGQVLVSGAAAALLGDSVPLVELGTFRLKDVRAPERVFQVALGELRGPFLPLRAERRVSLPSRRAGFVGRESEAEDLLAALEPGAVVTVTGPGGVGKTRLATETAGRALDQFPDGVWFCDLAAVPDGDSLPRAVAATLDAPPQEGTGPIESIVRTLGSDRALVILDNCEHVVREAAGLARALREGCSRVTVLATSRERLGLSGEAVRPLSPLSSDTDAVRLFELRARELDPDYRVEADLLAVQELCRRLDRVPLAIELAAARVRALGARELLDRLEDRFRLLRDSRREGAARHRALQATVDWSYRMLDETAQKLLDIVSVFAGPFDLAAAIALGEGSGIDELETIDLLTELVDRSLLTVGRSGETIRYRMLETLRHYGEAMLRQRGTLAEVRRRHARYFGGLAQRARRAYESRECLLGVELFESSWDDLRAAALWALRDEDDAGLRRDLIEGTYRFGRNTHRMEVGDWARSALLSGDDAPLYHAIAAQFANIEADYPRAVVHAEAMSGLADPITAPETVYGHDAHAVALWHGGQVEPALAAHERFEVAARAAGSMVDLGLCLGGRVVLAASLAPSDAPGYAHEARRIAAEVGSLSLHAWTYLYSAAAEQAVGQDEAAARYGDRALDAAIQCGDRAAESQVLAWRSVRAPLAERALTYRATLRRLEVTRHWTSTWVCLESVGHASGE